MLNFCVGLAVLFLLLIVRGGRKDFKVEGFGGILMLIAICYGIGWIVTSLIGH